ncbi:MAG: site-2 protease family protein [Clostridia bacterium]|nr:site-2 protease family protein [Loktanella sp.]MBQ1950228.1 site-2 protease family protein [Clostridia bacterium]
MIQYFLLYRNNMSVWDLLLLILAYAILVLVILPFHEFAHAWVAYKCGDNTAKWHGRLTLNPFVHLTVPGTLLLVLCGFGYAKPVPVVSRNFRHYKRDMILVALAGPLSNLLLAVVAVAAFSACALFITDYVVLAWLKFVLLDVLMSVNITLAVFNLLPIPPLDGSRLWSTLLPGKWAYIMERYSRYSTIILFALLLMGVLDGPLYWLQKAVTTAIFAVFGLR